MNDRIRVLIISAHYPPHHFGGYELRCKDICDELSRRGYEVLVITSRKKKSLVSAQKNNRYHVFRKLTLRKRAMSLIDQLTRWQKSYIFGMLIVFVRELLFDLRDIGFIDQLVRKFQPDLIYLGHTIVLSKAIIPYLASCEKPLIYDEGGSGLIDAWKDRGIWYKFIHEYKSRYAILNLIKSSIVRFVCLLSGDKIKDRWAWPSNMQVIFNSKLNYMNAVSKNIPLLSNAKIIHSGIDIDRFKFLPSACLSSPVKFVVPGRIEPKKGQLDAVRLLAQLRDLGIDGKMVIAGKIWSNTYYKKIENEINFLHLEDKITLMSMVTRKKIIDLYHWADFCFFPSYQSSGFSRVPLEAMACGCIIISYGNEGSDEIIRDKHTGFVFRPKDYQDIVDQIKKIKSIPGLIKKISGYARYAIEENYSMKKYVDSIERVIVSVIEKDK